MLFSLDIRNQSREFYDKILKNVIHSGFEIQHGREAHRKVSDIYIIVSPDVDCGWAVHYDWKNHELNECLSLAYALISTDQAHTQPRYAGPQTVI